MKQNICNSITIQAIPTKFKKIATKLNTCNAFSDNLLHNVIQSNKKMFRLQLLFISYMFWLQTFIAKTLRTNIFITSPKHKKNGSDIREGN